MGAAIGALPATGALGRGVAVRSQGLVAALGIDRSQWRRLIPLLPAEDIIPPPNGCGGTLGRVTVKTRKASLLRWKRGGALIIQPAMWKCRNLDARAEQKCPTMAPIATAKRDRI
ncbi:hypothetical protein BDZ91DRAFT_823319 [Kalaharituber pfeilii]|nr:hypothetical protein BDZ91DRAFT_823319 [Kalaharituber pfeilii]